MADEQQTASRRITPTVAGRNLLAEVMATEGELKFTRVVIGDSMNGNQTITINPEDLETRTAMVNEIMTMPIVSGRVTGTGTFIVSARLQNNNLDHGVKIAEIGVFAKNMKAVDAQEVLYAYRNTGAQYDFLPVFNEEPVDLIYQLMTVIDRAENVTIEISDSPGEITRAELLDHIDSLNPHPNFLTVGEEAETAAGVYVHNQDRKLDRMSLAKFKETMTGDLLPDAGLDENLIAWMREHKEMAAITEDTTPVGRLVLDIVLRPGYVKANGAAVLREDYPRLVYFADKEELWTDEATFTGIGAIGTNLVRDIAADQRQNLHEGDIVEGCGVPEGARIKYVGKAARLTLSAAATVSASEAELTAYKIVRQLTFTGDTRANDSKISNVPMAKKPYLRPGIKLFGSGIPTNATIVAVESMEETITLTISTAATETAGSAALEARDAIFTPFKIIGDIEGNMIKNVPISHRPYLAAGMQLVGGGLFYHTLIDQVLTVGAQGAESLTLILTKSATDAADAQFKVYDLAVVMPFSATIAAGKNEVTQVAIYEDWGLRGGCKIDGAGLPDGTIATAVIKESTLVAALDRNLAALTAENAEITAHGVSASVALFQGSTADDSFWIGGVAIENKNAIGVGMGITGSGIPAGAIITGLFDDEDGKTFTLRLSVPATATDNVTLTVHERIAELPITGNITTGSDRITNVSLEQQRFLRAGVKLSGLGLSEGTKVVAAVADEMAITLTISPAAGASSGKVVFTAVKAGGKRKADYPGLYGRGDGVTTMLLPDITDRLPIDCGEDAGALVTAGEIAEAAMSWRAENMVNSDALYDEPERSQPPAVQMVAQIKY